MPPTSPPTIPFWLGEAPARTAELSAEVGDLRAELEPAPGRRGTAARRRTAVRARAGVSEEVADQVVAYLGVGLLALGLCPPGSAWWSSVCSTTAEGTQLIIHAPYGGRINRALGLALRKRFCVSFDFELQAAADDDTVVLSLGPQHSFPLPQVPADAPTAPAPATPWSRRCCPTRCWRPGGGGTSTGR